MNKLALSALVLLFLSAMTGCSPAETATPPTPSDTVIPPTNTASPVPPTLTPSPIPPTLTPLPTATATLSPTATALPGLVVYPVDTLGTSIPWLPMDKSSIPSVHYIGFNTLLPPFNNAMVRQAFAHAIDREVLVDLAIQYRQPNIIHATSLTPPAILGRDLYGEVGIGFEPQLARDLLNQAGYADPSAFPAVELLVGYYGDIAPGAWYNMAQAVTDMWKTHLGVKVDILVLDRPAHRERLRNDLPALYWMRWVADYNDPQDFLDLLFHSGSEYNYGGFSNALYDLMVERAAGSRDPAERQELYIRAERLLCEVETPLIPLMHFTHALQ